MVYGDSVMEIRKIPIDKINPAPYNPRKDLKPGDPEYEKLKRSMQEFGYVEPIVWNKRTGNIVGGHQRYKVLLDMGMSEVDCVVVDLDETKEKALNLALNKIQGDWDYLKLKDILQELDTRAFDLELTGFDMEEIEDLVAQINVPEEITEDDVPEPPEEPVTKPGDLWLLGRHRLLCGDATVAADVERLMDGKKADMVFTDPPYGLGGYAGRSGKFNAIKGDDEDVVKFYQCIPKTKERYIWGNWQVLKTVIQEQPRDVIVWVKNNFGMGKGYRGQYEICFYFGNFDGSDSDVWQIDKDVNYKHPTQKPVALAARAIKNSSKLEDIVLDLFGGSGSTLIACEQLNRTCYMMEIDPVYCDVIVKRWENLTGQKAVLAE